jgi:hypothetical protein
LLAGKLGLIVFGCDDGSTPVKAAVRASAMRQNGFSTIGAATPLGLGEVIMGAALVLHPFRGSSFWYWHRLSPIFPCASAADTFSRF